MTKDKTTPKTRTMTEDNTTLETGMKAEYQEKTTAKTRTKTGDRVRQKFQYATLRCNKKKR